LILVSVGTMGYDFSRFLQIIDELCDENVIEGSHIIAQIGVNSYSPKNFKSFDFITHDEYENYLKDADYIITHAGTGSVIPPLKMGKKLILFPRLAEFSEHLDNHQSELADLLEREGYVLVAKDKESLKKCINNVAGFQVKEFKSNTLMFNNLVIDFIEGI